MAVVRHSLSCGTLTPLSADSGITATTLKRLCALQKARSGKSRRTQCGHLSRINPSPLRYNLRQRWQRLCIPRLGHSLVDIRGEMWVYCRVA